MTGARLRQAGYVQGLPIPLPVLLIGTLFLLVRLVGLGSGFLWADDVATFTGQGIIARGLPWRSFWAESLDYAFTEITGPILPTILVRAIANLVGPHVLWLRLPALTAGLAAFFLLDGILAQTVSRPAARLTPLLLFALSVPAIVYSQSIQPSTFYILATLIQCHAAIGSARRVRQSSTQGEAGDPKTIVGEIYRLSFVSLAVWFISYLSVVVHTILTLYLLLHTVGTRRAAEVQSIVGYVRESVIAAAPILLLTLVRLGLGGTESDYFAGIYYPASAADLVRLSYDFLSFHLNFAYNPALYQPLGANWPVLPFLPVCVLGLAALAHRTWRHAVTLAAALLLISAAAALEGVPIGGVRHSYAFAPAIFLGIGYGVETLAALRVGSQPRAIARWSALALCGLAVAIFALSGRELYAARASSLDLSRLVALAQERGIRQIAGYRESYALLAMWDQSAHGILARNGLRLIPFDADEPPDEPYLLVSYRSAFEPNPAWPPMAQVVIPRAAFSAARITPLVEEPGPLDPLRMRMVVQSLYYPLNGFFVYQVEPGP